MHKACSLQWIACLCWQHQRVPLIRYQTLTAVSIEHPCNTKNAQPLFSGKTLRQHRVVARHNGGTKKKTRGKGSLPQLQIAPVNYTVPVHLGKTRNTCDRQQVLLQWVSHSNVRKRKQK